MDHGVQAIESEKGRKPEGISKRKQGQWILDPGWWEVLAGGRDAGN